MESGRSKLSDPNYVGLVVAGLDLLRSGEERQRTEPGHAAPPQPASGAAGGGIDASDLLGFFYSPQQPTAPSKACPPAQDDLAFLDYHRRSAEAARETIVTSDNAPPPVLAIQEGKEILSLEESAGLLGIDPNSILGLIAIGKLSAFQDQHGQWLITRQSLDNINICRTNTTPGASLSGPRQEIDLTIEESIETASRVHDSPANPSPSGQMDLPGLIAKLEEAQSQLEKASYRIGFLEAELSASEQTVKSLPGLDAHEQRLSILERENHGLRLRLESLERRPRGFLNWLVSILPVPRQPASFSSQVAHEVNSDHYLARRARKDFY